MVESLSLLKGRCYGGECKMRENQCKYIWGPSKTNKNPRHAAVITGRVKTDLVTQPLSPPQSPECRRSSAMRSWTQRAPRRATVEETETNGSSAASSECSEEAVSEPEVFFCFERLCPAALSPALYLSEKIWRPPVEGDRGQTTQTLIIQWEFSDWSFLLNFTTSHRLTRTPVTDDTFSWKGKEKVRNRNFNSTPQKNIVDFNHFNLRNYFKLILFGNFT